MADTVVKSKTDAKKVVGKKADSKKVDEKKDTKRKNDLEDIDDLFSKAKAKKQKVETEIEALEDKPAEDKKVKTKSSSDSGKEISIKAQNKMKSMPIDNEDADELFKDSRGKRFANRKRTEEGYRVYDNEEMRIGEGEGNTKDCPFDCWCCY